jgi:dGTPase
LQIYALDCILYTNFKKYLWPGKNMNMQLANFACDPIKTRGRLHPELPTPYRNEFQRDKDRIIHSNAFRRLEYKTQVFVNHEGDHYRNRLTHSIEVASVARSIAEALDLSPDLAETISLAHDMGHTPFGHAGEDALDECMKNYGGFCHNAQSIKLLTFLEQRYAAYDGLNLTWEVLEGIAKHNGPLIGSVPESIIEYNAKHNLELNTYASAEAQVSSLADDIAYQGHDIEDAVRAELLRIEDLEELEFLADYIKLVKNKYPDIHINRLVYELIRYLNHYFVDDLLAETRKNIKDNNIETIDDIRNRSSPIVAFSKAAEERLFTIKKFLFDKVYYHEKVQAMTFQAKQVVQKLFDLYMNFPESLPLEWQDSVKGKIELERAKIVSDYIAGMTDRYAIRECQTLCNLKFENVGF